MLPSSWDVHPSGDGNSRLTSYEGNLMSTNDHSIRQLPSGKAGGLVNTERPVQYQYSCVYLPGQLAAGSTTPPPLLPQSHQLVSVCTQDGLARTPGTQSDFRLLKFWRAHGQRAAFFPRIPPARSYWPSAESGAGWNEREDPE